MCSWILPALQKAFCLGSWRPWKPKERKRGKGPEAAGPTFRLLLFPETTKICPCCLSACFLQDRLGNRQRNHSGAQRASAVRLSLDVGLPAAQHRISASIWVPAPGNYLASSSHHTERYYLHLQTITLPQDGTSQR